MFLSRTVAETLHSCATMPSVCAGVHGWWETCNITTFQVCLLPTPPRDCINCIKCIVSQRNIATFHPDEAEPSISISRTNVSSSPSLLCKSPHPRPRVVSWEPVGDLDVICFSHILSLGPLFTSVFLCVYPYSCDSMEWLNSMDFIDAKWCKYCFLRGLSLSNWIKVMFCLPQHNLWEWVWRIRACPLTKLRGMIRL